MSDIRFDFDWLDPQGARGLELRATWARLQILVDHQPITRLLDLGSRSVRDDIYLPLYPLAEWIAIHWWQLFYETRPNSRSEAEYSLDHQTSFAREGYSLPLLTVQPMGEVIRLSWHSQRLDHQGLEFLSSGAAYIETSQFRDSISRFVDAVVARLSDCDVAETLLEAEWDEIKNTDPETAQFCAAAAALGLEPYATSDDLRESILHAANRLPSSLAQDFFSVSTPRQLEIETNRMLEAIEAAKAHALTLGKIKDLRGALHQTPGIERSPWRQGYACAHRLRNELGLNGMKLNSFQALEEALNTKDLANSLSATAATDRLIDGVVGIDSSNNPGFALAKGREESRRFTFCRGLFQFLASEGDQPLLITSARTSAQQRSRAFAAELLAPSELLRAQIKTDALTEDEVDQLASEYGVSSLVISHQVTNHKIASISAA